MSSLPDSPLATTPPDDAESRAAERFAMLRELAEAGMEMARALRREVQARTETEG